jgi:hypothetical protein
MAKATTHLSFAVPSSAPLKPSRILFDRVRRLRTMPLAEIAGRSRQEAAKLLDRVTAERRIDPQAVLREHAPALARPDSARRIVREIAPGRFFAGVERPGVVTTWLPEYRSAVVKSAEDALQNRFHLLSYHTLWFGEPIDWHFDPVWSRRAPKVHWTQVDPLDPQVVGDSKIVWELNRHQWIARLAEAYALTADERYAEHALASIESWIEANPYGVGVNWTSSLEVAYRVMSWAWTLMLVRDAEALSNERLTILLANVWLHARYVARYLSHYFSPNTHLTGEALGLFFAGTLFPEFRDARRWRDVGAQVLVSESRSQICADGVHFERSTCYHLYTLDTYQQFALLALRNGTSIPNDLWDRLGHSLEFLLAIRRPDGTLPEIGDADGGRLMPLAQRDQCDPRGAFAVGAVMFARADFAWAAQGLTPEVPWLTGEGGASAFASLPRHAPATPRSRLFPSGGYLVMNTAPARDAHQMIIDAGPLGCPFSCGHGHADLLSVQCSAFGEAILVDAGTYCYTAQREWRNYFRGTAAHNTVVIDRCDQVEMDGPFSWHGRAAVHVGEWKSDSEYDFIDASHTAYAPMTHRRRVLFVKPHYWVIVDDIFGADPASEPFHQIDLGFQFAPMAVRIMRERWARAQTPEGNTFWVGAFAPAALRSSVKTGELAPIRGWISRDYGQRTPAPQLVYSTRTPLPWRCISLLIPVRGCRDTVPQVSPLFDDRNLPIGLALEDINESLFVDETDIFRSTDH